MRDFFALLFSKRKPVGIGFGRHDFSTCCRWSHRTRCALRAGGNPKTVHSWTKKSHHFDAEFQSTDFQCYCHWIVFSNVFLCMLQRLQLFSSPYSILLVNLEYVILILLWIERLHVLLKFIYIFQVEDNIPYVGYFCLRSSWRIMSVSGYRICPFSLDSPIWLVVYPSEKYEFVS